ncbi:unnamed protein product [Lymnaea stagnalis]|uniref:nitric-oxide synthase (NADPH) n=1 Tax=Lymnaea stagnalis TaxID=6523 RepID=A0AAV2HTC8_LYMST
MENYHAGSLVHESVVLVITSRPTYGNGEPPENGKSFAASLLHLKRKNNLVNGKVTDSGLSLATCIKRSIFPEQKISLATNVDKPRNSLAMATGPLGNIRFAVFSLGSNAYPHFAIFGKYIDKIFKELGAEMLVEYCTGDALYGQEQSFRTWSEEVYRAAFDAFCLENVDIKEAIGPRNMGDHSWSLDKVRIVLVDNGKEQDLSHVLSEIHGKKVEPFILSERTQLQAQDSKW